MSMGANAYIRRIREEDYSIINQREVYIVSSSPYKTQQCSSNTQGIFVIAFY